MFELLDSIDWTELTTASEQPATNVPEKLRQLLSTEEEVRQRGFASILWELNAQSYIFEATPAAIPFLIACASSDNTPDQALILTLLDEFTESCEYELWETVQVTWPPRLGRLRLVNDAYEKLAAGYPIYLRLLTHVDDHVRRKAAQLVGHFLEHAETSVEALWAAITSEVTVSVTAAQLRSVGLLVGFIGDSTLRDTYRSRLLDYALSSPHESISVEASIAAMCARIYGSDISETLPPTLIKKLVAVLALPENYEITERILDVLRREKSETIVEFLAVRPLEPEAAHLLGRELLAARFHRISGISPNERRWLPWRDEGDWRRFETSARMNRQRLNGMYKGGGFLNLYKNEVLRTIINCDPFWELPTNLFSSIFGLSDDRDELRKLLGD